MRLMRAVQPEDGQVYTRPSDFGRFSHRDAASAQGIELGVAPTKSFISVTFKTTETQSKQDHVS